jgi:hypothetical protein
MGKKLMGLMPCFIGYHGYIFTIAHPPIFSCNDIKLHWVEREREREVKAHNSF